jgi:hypothetical protein
LGHVMKISAGIDRAINWGFATPELIFERSRLWRTGKVELIQQQIIGIGICRRDLDITPAAKGLRRLLPQPIHWTGLQSGVAADHADCGGGHRRFGGILKRDGFGQFWW